MSSSISPTPDSIAVVIPVHNDADRLPKLLADWDRFLAGTGREYSLVVVNDGSSDGTGATATDSLTHFPRLKLLAHEKQQGFGACLRTALPKCTFSLVAHVATDYPYTPSDLAKLLERLDQPCEFGGIEGKPVAASGTRCGRPAPAFWRAVGWSYRVFCRLALGSITERAPGWLGARNHARSWFTWLTMGVPLIDVNCGLKVFRRHVFDRFPIQSDGDFAHAEVFAKLTFLTSFVAEEPLTPSTELVPTPRWKEFWKVFNNPQFHSPLPDLSTPSA
jgi:glycosyltransferase involved in cell wall biosynthesis